RRRGGGARGRARPRAGWTPGRSPPAAREVARRVSAKHSGASEGRRRDAGGGRLGARRRSPGPLLGARSCGARPGERDVLGRVGIDSYRFELWVDASGEIAPDEGSIERQE